MKDVLIRQVPDEVVERLKLRAERSGRSLQQELLRILIHEASSSVGAYIDEVRERQAKYDCQKVTFEDSTAQLRRARDER